MRRIERKILGSVFLALAIVLFGIVAYNSSNKRDVPLVFSERSMINSLWVRYKDDYLEKGTLRALDKQQGNITTSEGQSYTLLRAVWLDDKAAFDTAWKWTKDNLDRPSDNLFAWLFGKKTNGEYGILTTRGGENSASDADTDIAFALLMAARRWDNPGYETEAKAIISDIWKEEVVTIAGKPYLVANNLEKNNPTQAIVNPSYFAPYAYRAFAKVDSAHNWMGLVDTSYDILDRSLRASLDKKTSAGLPPDWIAINKKTGKISATGTSNLTTHYSYDALRLPWRIALDWKWHKEARAKETLSLMSFLDREWETTGKIAAGYSHDGTPLEARETPAMYGGSIGYFVVTNPDRATEIYTTKLKLLYTSDTQSWKKALGYYDDNWAWFGIALYADLLPNLAS